MLKKAILILFLALQFGVMVNVSTASMPMPGCFPCDEAR